MQPYYTLNEHDAIRVILVGMFLITTALLGCKTVSCHVQVLETRWLATTNYSQYPVPATALVNLDDGGAA